MQCKNNKKIIIMMMMMMMMMIIKLADNCILQLIANIVIGSYCTEKWLYLENVEKGKFVSMK